MSARYALIGVVVFTGAGLLAVADDPRPAAPVSAPAAKTQAKPAAAPAPKAAATPAANATQPKRAPATAGNETQSASPSPDVKPILEGLKAFIEAYNAPNAEALAALFTEDASVVDPAGAETRGRTEIAQMYATSFEDVPGLTLEADAKEIRFLTPDVARVEGESSLSSSTGDASEHTRYSSLMVRRDGKWLVAELREYPAPAEDVTPYERLKELEWMVGDWVDESDGNRVSASIRWADNKSYLVRTYRVDLGREKVSSGTMFVGWDPQSGQIKSWVFDSEGGHGEGLWTRASANEWIVKAHGVLRDGRPTSATQIHTIVNKDVVKTSSVDRIIGGQIAADILDIFMVRKAPQPGLSEVEPASKPGEAAPSKPAEAGSKPGQTDVPGK